MDNVKIPLTEGDSITLTHQGVLTTFTMVSGEGELFAVVEEVTDYPIWGFYPNNKIVAYELKITGRASAFTIQADETRP